MAEIRFRTPPHERQQQFIEAAEKEQLFGGAKRGGKSHGLSQKIVMLMEAFPGNRGLLYRQNLTDLKDSTLVTFLQVCPPELIRGHHLGDRKVTFKNGSELIYRGVGDEKELEKVKGIGLGFMAGDEPSEIEEATYLMLLGQLDWQLPNRKRPPYMSLLACNPEPGWVKKRFIDQLEQDKDGEFTTFKASKDRIFIPSVPTDNPYLPRDYVQFLLDNFPFEWVEKYVRGSWEVSEGMVYKEFDRKTHVVHSCPPLQHMSHFGAIDVATTGITTLLVIGVTANHDYVCHRLYYAKDKLVSEHAIGMHYIINGLRRAGVELEYILIDPASGQRSSQGNSQLQDMASLYAEQGIHTIPAWNVMEAGIERVKQLLHPVLGHAHPLTGDLTLPNPHWYIVGEPEMQPLIDEFLGWKKDVDANGYVKYKGKDHALDPARYIAVSRPRPPALTSADIGAMDAVSQKAIRSHDRWARGFDRQVRRAAGAGAATHFDYFNGGQQ